MNHYRAIRKTQGFQLVPVLKEAVYAAGFYSPEDNSLHLQSTVSYQDFKFVAKIDEYGAAITKHGKQQVERRTIDHNYQFQLTGDDITWFIDSFVENATDAKEWIHPVGHQGNPEEGFTTQQNINNNE